MARRAQKRIYGVSGHPMIEALPLATAFIVGVVGSSVLKLVPGFSLLAAIFAAVVLVVYAIYAYFATQLRLDAETIGDNCYYLGFLFTLTSLSITLALVVGGDNNNYESRIPSIISGFGIALSSTIVGVFLRVFMMQFKVDMESRERQERQHLNEASRRFRTELSQSLDRIKSFSVESAQQSAELEKRLKEAFDQLMADMQQELLKSAADFGPALRDSVRQQTQSSLRMVSEAANESATTAAASIQKALAEMSVSVAESSKQNSEAVDILGRSIQSLVASTETIAQGSKTTIEILAHTQIVAAEMTEAFTREAKDGVERIAQEMFNACKRLENGAGGLADASIKASLKLQEQAEHIENRLKQKIDPNHATEDAVIKSKGASSSEPFDEY